jgi:hypothetical protein
LVGQTNDFNIITKDINNFWEAVDNLKVGKDTTQIFQSLVLDRASDEFKVFIKIWKIKASDYAYQIRRYPKYYETLRKQSYKLINSEDSIRRIVKRFRNLYPAFKPADICIAFGNFNTGGNIAIERKKNLVYIGLEYHGPDSSTFIKELSISTQDYVSRSNFFRTIIHELVHIQQRTHGNKVIKALNGNLLANRIIIEGIPDFISQLIVPYGNNGNYFEYGLRNEDGLKWKLYNELWNFGSSDWFGGSDSLFTTHPRDLGYFMGLRIGQSFYNKNNLQNINLTSLIEIKNLKRFINESQYFEGL